MRIIIDIPDFDRPLDMNQVVMPGHGHGEDAVGPETLGDVIKSDIMTAINNDTRLAMTAIWVPHAGVIQFEDLPEVEQQEVEAHVPDSSPF